jgi:transposase
VLRIENFEQILLYRPYVDMRMSVGGLSGIVQSELGKSPFGKTLFVFTNKRRKLIKLFYWDKNGFAIWYKKLETDLFAWPKDRDQNEVPIGIDEMKWLLEGVEYWKLKKHKELFFDET